MTKLIVVTGITGNQGSSVANTFLTDPSWRVRAITRDPSKLSAQEWASRGVELVRGDMDDVNSLYKAFTGAHAIFAMTDYWFPLFDPAVRAEAAKMGICSEERAAAIEVQRGKNLAHAAAMPEVLKTLERYVYSSLADHLKLSGGKYTHSWHFDSKAAVEQYVRDNPNLGPKSSFIHVGHYADNWTRTHLEIQRDPVSGGYWHIDVGDGRRLAPIVWTQRDTGPLVRKLVEDVQPGTRLLAVSQMLTYREFMATWAKVLGKKLAGDEGIKQVAEQDFKEMVGGDESHKDHLLQSYLMLRDFGYDGGDEHTVYPEDIGAEGLMTSFEEYVKQEDWSSLFKRER